MRDDFLTSGWADHRGGLIDGLHKLLVLTRQSFDRLNAYQFDAPWRREQSKHRPA